MKKKLVCYRLLQKTDQSLLIRFVHMTELHVWPQVGAFCCKKSVLPMLGFTQDERPFYARLFGHDSVYMYGANCWVILRGNLLNYLRNAGNVRQQETYDSGRTHTQRLASINASICLFLFSFYTFPWRILSRAYLSYLRWRNMCRPIMLNRSF